MAKKGGKAKPKDKKTGEKKPKTSRKLYSMYSEGKNKNKTCPKCGPGMFMGQHKDRVVCGSCGYVEFTKKEVPVEEKPAEKAEA